MRYIVTLGAEDREKAEAKYSLGKGERFWLHRESSVLGPRFGRGGDHLWKWDGQKPTPLEEGFNSWIS